MNRLTFFLTLLLLMLHGLGAPTMGADVASVNALFPNLEPTRLSGSVFAVLQRPDGKIYVGGEFNAGLGLPKAYLALIDPVTGAVDNAFNPVFNGSVSSLALKADGKLYVGGIFTTAGGVARNHLALVDGVTGALDVGFDAGTQLPYVTELCLRPDGKLYAGGYSAGGGSKTLVLVNGVTGVLDGTFVPSFHDTSVIYSLLLRADGKLYVGGWIDVLGDGIHYSGVVLVDGQTGVLDGSFAPNITSESGQPWSEVHSLVLRADGKLYVGGYFDSVGGLVRNSLALINGTTGAVYSSFDPGNAFVSNVGEDVGQMLLGSNDKLYVSKMYADGLFLVDGLTGALDVGFGTNLKGCIPFVLALRADGKVYAGGSFSSVGGVTRKGMCLVDGESGVLDANFQPTLLYHNSPGNIFVVLPAADGKVFVGGDFNFLGGVSKNALALVDGTTGAVDNAFEANVQGAVRTLALKSDGKLYVGGDFNFVGGMTRNRLALVDGTTGALVGSFDASLDNTPTALALRGDGKLYVGGQFTSVGGVTRNRLALVDGATGSLDITFYPQLSGFVNTLLVKNDGGLFVGGSFATVGGVIRSNLALLDGVTGVVDGRFNIGNMNGSVNALALNNDGNVYVGGSFFSLGGATRNHLALVNGVTGAVHSDFDPDSVNGQVMTLALRSDGKLYAGGQFRYFGGVTRHNLALVDGATGAVDGSFNPDFNNNVNALALKSDGKLYVAGFFTAVGATTRSRMALLDVTSIPPPTPTLQDLSTTPIISGSSYTLTGNATFVNFNTGIDSNINDLSGNEPFAQGGIVRALTNLNSTTSLKLGNATAARSVVNITANPFFLGLNHDYSPNSGLLAFTNAKADLTVENVSLTLANNGSGFSNSTEAGGTNYLNNIFSVFQFLNNGTSAASIHNLNLKDVDFTGYPFVGGSGSTLSLFHAQRFPVDPAATNLSTAVMSGQLDFNATLDNVTTSAFSFLGSINAASSGSLTVKGGSQLIQPTDIPNSTPFFLFRDVRGQASFTLMDAGTLVQVTKGNGIVFSNSGTLNVDERYTESLVTIAGGTLVTGYGQASNLGTSVEFSGQKNASFLMTGGTVLSQEYGVRISSSGQPGSTTQGAHFSMSGGLIQVGSQASASPTALHAVASDGNLGRVTFNMTGGEVRSAYASDVVRIASNNDVSGQILINLLGGSITANYDDPAVSGAPWATATAALRLRNNASASSVIIGDSGTLPGPTLSGRRFGIYLEGNTGAVDLLMNAGLIQTEHTPVSGTNTPYVTAGIEVRDNNVSALLRFHGGQIIAGTNGYLADGFIVGRGTHIILGTGNAVDSDTKMQVSATRIGVNLQNATAGSTSLLLQDGAAITANTAGNTVEIIKGHPTLAVNDSITIAGGRLMSSHASVRMIHAGAGNDILGLLRVRSTNLNHVVMGIGDDRLVLDQNFLSVQPLANFVYFEGGDQTVAGSAALSGIDTLRLQAVVSLTESITDNGGKFRSFNNLELAGGAEMTVSQSLEAEGGQGTNANNNVVLERQTPGPLTGAVGSGALLVGAATYPTINTGGGVDTLTLINVTGINAGMFGPAGSTNPNHLFRGFEVVNLGAGSQWIGSLDLASVGLSAVNQLPGSQFTGSIILTTGDDTFTYQGGSNVDVYGYGGVDTLVLASGVSVSGSNITAGSPLDSNASEFLDFAHLVLEDGSGLSGSYVTGNADNILTLYGTATRGSVNLGLGTDSLVFGTSGTYSRSIINFTNILGVEQVFLSTTGDARNTGLGDDVWQMDVSDSSLSFIDARLNSVTSGSVLGDTLVVPAGQSLAGSAFGPGSRYRGFESVSLAGSITGTLTLDSSTNNMVLEQGYDLSAGSVDAGAGTDYVLLSTSSSFVGNGSKFINFENIHLNNALSDTWIASATDSSVIYVEAGSAVDGSDLDLLDLSYATGTVRNNTANALVGSSGKYRSFERVQLGAGSDTWQAGVTSGVMSALTPGYVDAGAGTDLLEISTGASAYQASGLIGAASPYRNFEGLRINHGSTPASYAANASLDPASVEMVGAADALFLANASSLAVLSDDVGDASGAYQGFDSLSLIGDVSITASQTLGTNGSLEIIRSTPGSLASFLGTNVITAGSGTENQAILGNVTALVPADFVPAAGTLRGFEKMKLMAGSRLTGSHGPGASLEFMSVQAAEDGIIRPGVSGAAMLIMKNLDLSLGGTYACDVTATESDLIQVPAGTLTLGGSSKLVFQATAPDALVYVIATYDVLSGTFATIESLPSGYNLVYGYQGKNIALVKNSYYGFGAWAHSNGITLSGNASDYAVDTDGDTRSNLDEYLLGGNPQADDVAPVIAAPVGGFTPLTFIVAPGNTATLPDFLPQALISDPHGVASSSQSPAAGTTLGVGAHVITLSATDTPGNVGSLTLNVHVVTMPATISLSSPLYTVSQGASSAVVTLTRTGHMEPASVTLKTADGTTGSVPPYSPAVAGTDYTAVDTVVSFAAGETSKTVTLILSPKTGTQPNKRFWVTLRNPAAGSELGTQTSAMVRILSNDTTRPVLAVTAPTAATRALSAASPYLVTGTAGDANGIDRVEVVFNGAGPVTATLGSSTKNTSIPWSLEIVPVEGSSNTISVTAYDLKGNASLTVTRTFTYTRRYKLTVTRTAPVAVSQAGALTVVATPRTAATGFLPVIATANPKVSQILPGVPVKLTALHLRGYVFSHWASKPAGATELGNVLSFTMPAQDVVAEAVFVTNLFAAAAGEGNTFYGLLAPYGTSATGNSTVGWFTGTIVPGSGTFSGRVMIGGLSKAFAGTFYGDSGMFFTNATTKSRTISVGSRSMTLSIDSAGIHVALSEGAAQVVAGLAKRAQYSSANKVPVAMLNRKTRVSLSANDQGVFTVALPSKAQVPAKDMTTYPHGDGFGSVTLNNLGVVTMVGTLADGSTFLGSSGLVSNGGFPAYAQLVTPGAAATVKGGSLSGELTVDVAQANSDVSGADLLWIRPEVTQLTGTSAAAKATQLYTEGWPTGIRVDAVGAFYDRTKDVRTGLDLGPVNLTTGNGELVFTGGRLTGDMTVSAFNIEAGAAAGTSKVTKIPVANKTFTLTVAQGVGQFNGVFTPNWTNAVAAKPTFRGVLLQKGGSQGGYGYFISNRSGDADPQAGRVTLGKPTP
jgi:hypothetical protein